MKFKFPEGVTQYYDSVGRCHLADKLGEVDIESREADIVNEMLAVGFVPIIEDIELQSDNTPTDAQEDEEQPIKVVDETLVSTDSNQ